MAAPRPLSAEDVLRVNGSHRFAAAMAAASPFASLADALLAARRIWLHEVDVNGWLEAFAAHPAIRTTSPSVSKSVEQSAALSTAMDSTAQELAEWNARYTEKFGSVFTICASGRTAPEVLAELKRRYTNRPIVELEVAAEEELKITELRLAKLFSLEPTVPTCLSSISTNWTKGTLLDLRRHVCNDDVDGARMLLEGVASQDLPSLLDEKDNHGQNILHLACKNDATKCMEELLKLGANPKAVDRDGDTILHITIARKNTEGAVKILQNYQSSMSTVNSQRKTPLHLCIETLNTSLVSKWADTANEAEKNASVDVCGPAGPALCMAAALKKGQEECGTLVRKLLHAGANPLAKDDNGQSAVHHAVMKDDDELLKIILEGREQSELINITNARGRTPLHVALMNGARSCIDRLLSLKANCNIQDDVGENVFHVAARALQCRGNGKNLKLFVQMLSHSSADAHNTRNYRCSKPQDLLRLLPREFFDEVFKQKLKAYKIDLEPDVFDFDSDRDGIQKTVHWNTPCELKEVLNAGLVDANWAGGSKSKECTLILIEGNSAELFARRGIQALGNQGLDRYGTYPVRGKPPNVTGENQKLNIQLRHIMCALGLVLGAKDDQAILQHCLRYGHVMFMTDQDSDGFHIKGLLINAFYHYYPSLLRVPAFFQDFTTPILKATNRSTDDRILFKSLNEYESWACGIKLSEWILKYYKGLASHDREETEQYFRDLRNHVRCFYFNGSSDTDYLHRAFQKTRASERRTWIQRYEKGSIPDFRNEFISFGDFVNKELILYFIDDVRRSIPSAIDGLKPSQRKVLFVLLEIFGADMMKTYILAGSVAELTSYHHGPESLEGVIIAMAQDYAGSNNINLLKQGGHFGGRNMGGAFHGKAKYLSTTLSPITRLIFPGDDFTLLEHRNEDGLSVEPERYVPIVPLVLINGAVGIGSGYSCLVPSHNPLHVINNIRLLMQNKPIQPMIPWYHNFKGTIQKMPHDIYMANGLYESSGTKLTILELPIGSYYHKYEKKILGSLKKKGTIKGYERKQCTDGRTKFEVSLCEPMSKEEIEKHFHLNKNITWNLNLLNAKGKMVCYSSTEQVLRDFYKERLNMYGRRKIRMVGDLKSKIERLDSKIKEDPISIQLDELEKEKAKLSAEVMRLQSASTPEFEIKWWTEELDALEKEISDCMMDYLD